MLDMKQFQYNKSDMTLETKDWSLLEKCSRTISIHYFTIKDPVDRGDVTISHCPTDEMVGDFYQNRARI